VPKSAQVIMVHSGQFGHQGRFCLPALVSIPCLKTSESGLVKADDWALSMPEDSPMDLLRVGIDPNRPTMVHS